MCVRACVCVCAQGICVCVCLQGLRAQCYLFTHGIELGHFQNDPILTEMAGATIHNTDIIFDLFQY